MFLVKITGKNEQNSSVSVYLPRVVTAALTYDLTSAHVLDSAEAATLLAKIVSKKAPPRSDLAIESVIATRFRSQLEEWKSIAGIQTEVTITVHEVVIKRRPLFITTYEEEPPKPALEVK